MMADWEAGDKDLLGWREETGATAFEKAANAKRMGSQTYFDEAVVLVAMVKAGVELAYEIMVESGIKPESAYYESLHELPLIANLISRKKLYEMNRVISDTAEYGNYLFSRVCEPLLKDFMGKLNEGDLGSPYPADEAVDDVELITVNESIRSHSIEKVGKVLRAQMKGMKALAL